MLPSILLAICIAMLCSCSVAMSQTAAVDTPAAWQTDPTDSHVSWAVSEESRKLSLAWNLKENIKSGTWLRVRTSGLHCLSPYSVTAFSYGSKADPHGIVISNRYTPEAQQKDWMYFVFNPYLVAGQAPADLPKGTQAGVDGTFSKYKVSGNHFLFRLESADSWDGPWKPVSGWSMVDTAPLEASSMEAYIRADGTIHILYLDKFGNPAAPEQHDLKISDPAGNVLMSTKIENSSVLRIEPGLVPSGVERVLVKDDKGRSVMSTPRPAPGIGGLKTYFGEMHFHTEYSGDGHRPIRETLNSARDQLGLDFASPGDHMPFSNGYQVETYLDLLDSYNNPGRYVTLLGYELSAKQGHFNPYYRDRKAASKWQAAYDDFAKDPENTKPYGLTLQPFFKHFDPEEITVIPHHTNTTSGKIVNKAGYAMWRNFDWRAADDGYNRIVEIVQGRGCFECEETDPQWRIYSGGYGSSIRTALARGLRMGFVGGSDNHTGWPTRYSGEPGLCALTGVQARDLTREAIFESLRARRTYATTGQRIVLDFTLNGQYPMGSEAQMGPQTKRSFRVLVRGTAPVERVEIVSQGAVIAKLQTDNKQDLDIEWIDPRPDAPIDDCYYYVRVRQTNGHCAWSNPIWIDHIR